MTKKMRKKKDGTGMKECTLYVDGMHCASCEVLIEKKLLKQKGIESVDASVSSGEVHVVYEENKPEIDELNNEFAVLGYTFAHNKFKKKSDTPLISVKSGSISINPKRLKNVFRVGISVLIIVIGFLLIEESGVSSRVTITQDSNIPAYFVFGLFAGASTCAALVGGVLLSMSKQWNEVYIDANTMTKRAVPHVLFHAGRLLSFALVGGAVALIGSAAKDLISDMSIIITLFVALLMFVMGAQMLEWKWSQKFTFHLPKSVGRYIANESNFKGKYMPFTTGFLSFLIPCGLTLTAFTMSLESGSFVNGAINMFAFALGTLVFLGIISLMALGFTSKPIMTVQFNKVAGLLIIFFALFTFNAQVITVNAKYQKNLPTASSIAEIFSKEESTVAEVNDENVQIITMKVDGYSFEPSRFQVKAGIPVEWRINGQKASGCTGRIIGKGLFSGEVEIAGMKKIITFTPIQKGTYTFSCWMGMVSGQIDVV